MDDRGSRAAFDGANGDGAVPGLIENGDSFPGVVAHRLSALGSVVPPPEIHELWVFPPLEDVEPSAEFLLFTRFLDGERRGLYSARMLPANGSPAKQVVVEHGSVPADRVPRMVGQLQRRLGRIHEPRHVLVDGELEVWEALIGDEAYEAALVD